MINTLEEMQIKIPSFEGVNEKVRETLRDNHPQEDVIVKIGPNQFFGFWKWSEEQQSHMRVAVDNMRRLEKSLVSYAKGLTLVPIDENLIPLSPDPHPKSKRLRASWAAGWEKGERK